MPVGLGKEHMRIGVNYPDNGRCEFAVWAPLRQQVSVKLLSPHEYVIGMEQEEKGYWKATVENIFEGTRYLFRLDNLIDRPDPASNFQPEGVHGPSQVVDHRKFHWKDSEWRGLPLEDFIIYEVHVGAFTPQGTFGAVIPHLDYLKELGITAVELMPVAQFPGARNWGYDGVYPFAPQNSYGGPDGLKRFVNECHAKGIAVILDVVYNHLGPEGNYLRDFGPYFTDKYKTPWGQAINFDDAYSNEVRNFFIENALHWRENYHMDALRIDAIHGITDMSARPFLRELAERVAEFSGKGGRKFYLIAESDLNDSRAIRPIEEGGYGLDAQWNEDFHHCLHTLLTGEREGYYADFGKMEHLVKCVREGFTYSGQYSEYRKRDHGNSSKDRPAHQFIVFSQNHDQIGNRMFGERLSRLASFESLKLAAGAVLLSPYIPLLFMGEEYGEENPFLYFVSHSEPELIEAVRRGRKEEFRALGWKGEPPDPQSVEAFLESKLDWKKRGAGGHRVLLEFYKNLIRTRREIPALSNLDKDSLDVNVSVDGGVLFLRRWKGEGSVFCIFNFSEDEEKAAVTLPEGRWRKRFDSSDSRWDGPGSLLSESIVGYEEVAVRGRSFGVYTREAES